MYTMYKLLEAVERMNSTQTTAKIRFSGIMYLS